MNKKYVGIFGIVVIMLSTVITFPVIGEINEPESSGKTSYIAIGTFSHCDKDQKIYGHILFGIVGLTPIFNLLTEINDESILHLFMSKHFLYCVIEVEET
jgi:hypothetical protein